MHEERNGSISFHPSGQTMLSKTSVDGHKELALLYGHLGSTYLIKENLDQSRLFLEKAMNIYLTSAKDEEIARATVCSNLGHVYLLEEDYNNALEYFFEHIRSSLTILTSTQPALQLPTIQISPKVIPIITVIVHPVRVSQSLEYQINICRELIQTCSLTISVSVRAGEKYDHFPQSHSRTSYEMPITGRLGSISMQTIEGKEKHG